MRWEGATVLITGASRGIGRATARRAAERGASVALVARSAVALGDVLAECRGLGVAIPADVSRRHDVERAVADAVDQLGPIDILVNCAGIGAAAPFVVEDLDRVDQVIGTNLLGAVYTSRLVGSSMANRGRGHIVNVGSISGRVPVPFESVYCAAKFGLAGFTKAVALELKPLGVGVSLITLGPVDTGFEGGIGRTFTKSWPRPLRPEAVADAIIATVERKQPERTIPRWLVLGRFVETLAPAAYRFGANRAFSASLRSSCSGLREDSHHSQFLNTTDKP